MHVSGGDVFGIVQENTLVKHKIMVHPKEKGIVKWIAPRGDYTVDVRHNFNYLHMCVCVVLCVLRIICIILIIGVFNLMS